MKKKLFFFELIRLRQSSFLNPFLKISVSFILILLFITGCKKVLEEPGTTGVCPIVVSTVPTNNATGAALNTLISATFNEEIDPTTLNSSTFFIKQGNTNVAGSISYAGMTAIFTPAANLLPNTVYTGIVTTGIRDKQRNAPKANYVWSFTTGVAPDTIPPRVISTDPNNSDTNVVVTKIINATFSKVMNPTTLNTTTFSLRQGTTPITGMVTYTGSTASFAPTTNLAYNTTYIATITTGAKDMAGNALVSNYIWSFTTGIAPADVTPPTVTLTDPANAATGVGISKVIAANFSKAMNPTSINTTTFLLSQGTTPVAGSVTYSGITASFTPSANLLPNTVYTATITTGAKDLAGNALVNNYVWSFTTGITLGDVTPPTVISTDPPNAATGVGISKVIAANFSKVMNPATINTTTFLLSQGTTPIAGSVTYSGTTASFTPGANLLPNTVYTATITTGAKDVAGNALVNNYVWNFTTGITPGDVTPPTVISTDPTNGATGVDISKVIAANFSKAMNPTSINTTTFLLSQGTMPVAGSVTYSGTTARFTPNANLIPNTLYTATITTGAKDVAGNALASNYTWTFTTAATTIPPPALGSVALYGAFGGNAGITNQGLNTVINNGSIGTTAASTLITGFHDGTTGDVYTETPLNKGLVTGRIYTAPPFPGSAQSAAIAAQGLADATVLYNSISPAGSPGGSDPGAGELGGLTLAPGTYKSASGTFKITNGNLTLDAQGNPNAVWKFQTAAGLTVGVAGPAGARSVLLINGGLAKNVFWYVGSAAVINGAGGGVMTGNIISSAGITFSTAGNAVQTVLNGRAISLVASVTMVNTTVNVP